MNIVVLDSATLGDDIELSMLDKIGNVTEYKQTSYQELEERIKNTDVIVVNKVKLNCDNLKNAKSLKLICVTATGFDNIDLDYCKNNKIAVCNVRAYSTDSVAQVTVSMVLSLINHLGEYDKYTKSMNYTNSGLHNYLKPVYHEISSMTWGIIGLGNIGKKVAKIASAFGCEVIAYKNTPVSEYKCVDIDTLCKNSDIITVHVPLNSGTHNLINKDRIALMKKNVILVNVARGAVIDENAISQAVINNKIGAFGTDVYSVEPMQSDSPISKLIDYENVILTPHMAWGAYEARIRCMNEVSKNIKAFFDGETRNRIV